MYIYILSIHNVYIIYIYIQYLGGNRKSPALTWNNPFLVQKVNQFMV